MKLPPALWLLGVTVVCWGSVGFALYAQYHWDMLPCPWCTFQRLLYLIVGALSLLGALIQAAPLRRLLAFLGLLFSVAGVAAALWQQFVAAASDSCALTLADKILNGLGLFDLAPSVFAPMASCADAAVNLLGVPFAIWSAVLFLACAIVSLGALICPRGCRA